MDEFINQMRALAETQGQGRARTRHGVITGYDPETHSAKVKLQPDGTLTGWLPIKSLAVGNGWGIVFAPALGEAVEVAFQEDNGGAGTITGQMFNDEDRPPNTPSGEWGLVHKHGASIKFTNDGKLTLGDGGGAIVQFSNDGKVRITGEIICGKITASDDITTTGDVKANGISLHNHTHSGVATGSSNTGAPR